MADTKFSALPAITTPVGADELGINQSGVSKKITLTQLQEFVSDKGVDVASAGVLVLGAGEYFHITGTTTITDIDFTITYDGRRATLVFDGVLTLTHNATTLILPGGANIVTAAGDSCEIVVDSGDNVRVFDYQRVAQPPGKWTFLGTATNGSAAVTVGPVIWTGTYVQLMFEYLVTGYSGSAVARLLTGAASISTTAITNGNAIISGITLVVTSVSIPGLPLAGVVSAIARWGVGFIGGASGAFKQITASGHSGNPAVATAPTIYQASSFFTDLGTNLPLQRAQMTVYDTLTATTVSTTTMNTGSRLTVWGRNTD